MRYYERGTSEESLEYSEQQGVPSEYIPGISSAVAVAGIAGIPLTKRGFSERFMVITGNLRNREMSKDLYLASQSSAKVVILMSTGKLDEIVQLFNQQRRKD